MFLFASDASLLSRDRSDRRAIIRQFPGELHEVSVNSSVLVWTADAFTAVERGSHEITVQIRRPQIDREPICELRWRPAEAAVICRRRWSGEFSAYVSEDHRREALGRPCALITSHLKLAPLLLKRRPRVWKRIEPGQEASVRGGRIRLKNKLCWSVPLKRDYGETVCEVRRLVLESVASIPSAAALLLSGGIDSSVVAAASRLVNREVHAFTFGLDKRVRAQTDMESDLICARRVAAHLKIPLSEILLDSRLLVRNLPLGIYLAETPRGTIVDDCVALVEVARRIAEAGYSQVLMGEAADDLFGGFKFALRYYRGPQLRAYYRAQLAHDLPNELAIIQNVFAWFGISVVQPMWTSELLRIGYNLPLRFRLDRQRLMKQVLRDAFATDLPSEIVNRPKCVTRDSTQIRYVLEEEFGTGRERYRALFHIMMGQRARWPRKFLQQLKSSRT